MSRALRKSITQYRSLEDFWNREPDPIWFTEAWIREGLFLPCEGISMSLNTARVGFKSRDRLIWYFGLCRQLRAPCDLEIVFDDAHHQIAVSAIGEFVIIGITHLSKKKFKALECMGFFRYYGEIHFYEYMNEPIIA